VYKLRSNAGRLLKFIVRNVPEQQPRQDNLMCALIFRSSVLCSKEGNDRMSLLVNFARAIGFSRSQRLRSWLSFVMLCFWRRWKTRHDILACLTFRLNVQAHKLHFSVFTSSPAVTVSPSTTGSTVANSTHKALLDLLHDVLSFNMLTYISKL
jgi:hypothetical protein